MKRGRRITLANSLLKQRDSQLTQKYHGYTFPSDGMIAFVIAKIHFSYDDKNDETLNISGSYYYIAASILYCSAVGINFQLDYSTEAHNLKKEYTDTSSLFGKTKPVTHFKELLKEKENLFAPYKTLFKEYKKRIAETPVAVLSQQPTFTPPPEKKDNLNKILRDEKKQLDSIPEVTRKSPTVNLQPSHVKPKESSTPSITKTVPKKKLASPRPPLFSSEFEEELFHLSEFSEKNQLSLPQVSDGELEIPHPLSSAEDEFASSDELINEFIQVKGNDAHFKSD